MKSAGTQSTTIKEKSTTLRRKAELSAELENHEREIERLKTQQVKLLRQIDDEKRKKLEYVETLRDAVTTAASGLYVPRVPTPRIASGKRGTAEKALIVVSDLQLAKVTPTYNSDVCEKRMDNYAESILRITEIQRSDHPVDEARIYCLGDMLEGELIFPYQAYQLDAGLYTQLMVDGPRIMINFVRKLLTGFKRIHMVCVPGNHGEIGGAARRAYNPETNADRMLYHHIWTSLAREPRLTWQIPYAQNESAWYAVDYPFDKRFGNFMFHGHQIPNPGSASVATVARRIWGWASGGVEEPFMNTFFAHWHSPKYIPMNRYEIFCNGSTESTNIYAQERLSAIGQPVQLLCFQHPERNITAQYWVKLEKEPIVSPQSYNLPTPVAYEPVPEPKL